MADNVLEARRVALEESFFRKENERLRERMRIAREREAARKALASELGLRDEALLERLLDLGIRIDTVEALALAPLAFVAWADGEMEPHEHDAVMKGAEGSGIAPGSPGYALLETWTKQPPPEELMESWSAYIQALVRQLSADQRAALEERILGRARAVAEAAGGFLGLAKVSKEEEALLTELERAFGG